VQKHSLSAIKKNIDSLNRAAFPVADMGQSSSGNRTHTTQPWGHANCEKNSSNSAHISLFFGPTL
jgi:hypothetical protein